MTHLPDLSRLTQAEKDALILALWTQAQELVAVNEGLARRVTELEAKPGEPAKTPDNLAASVVDYYSGVLTRNDTIFLFMNKYTVKNHPEQSCDTK